VCSIARNIKELKNQGTPRHLLEMDMNAQKQRWKLILMPENFTSRCKKHKSVESNSQNIKFCLNITIWNKQ